MTHPDDQEPVLRFSSNGKESVDSRLGSLNPVAVRLQVDRGCNCRHNAEKRPGSYIDSNLALR